VPSSDAPQKVASVGLPLLNFVPKTFLLPSVRDLTITSGLGNKFGDLVRFLVLLWENYRIGQNLRKLDVVGDIDTTILVVPILRYLNHSDDKSVAFCKVQSSRDPRPCHITHLSIHFIPEMITMGVRVFKKYFSVLLKPLAPILSSFSLSYSCYPNTTIWRHDMFALSSPLDISDILETLPYLPALKEIRFQAPFTLKTMKKLGALTEWLRVYQAQLERLTIQGPTSKQEASDDSESDSDDGDMYSNWLAKLDQSFLGFPSLTFPVLRSLEICAGSRNIIPPLKKVTPSLRSLTIGYDDLLNLSDLNHIVQGLPTFQEGSRGLETLRLRFSQLTPALFDFLQQNLPQLKALEVNSQWPMVS
jgi:hypothetical protein